MNGAIILRLEIIKKVIMTIILATTIPISVMAIAWGMVAAAACEMVLNIGATLRYAGLKLKSLATTLLPIIALTAVMYLATEMVGYQIENLAVGLRLVIKIGVGIISYVAISFITRMEAFDEALAIAKQFLNKQK